MKTPENEEDFPSPTPSPFRHLVPLLYLLPAMLLFGIFKIYPIAQAACWSFTDLTLTAPEQKHWVGLENYQRVFQDSRIGLHESARQEWKLMFQPSTDPSRPTWKRWLTFDWPGGAFPNTLKFIIFFIPPYVIIPLLLAWMLDRIPRGAIFFRTFLFIPIIISTAIASVIWIILYNPNYGILNSMILSIQNLLNGIIVLLDGPASFFTFTPPNWLGDRQWAMPAITLVCLWNGIGMNVIFFQAGLSRINPEIHEAARVDGASATQHFLKITLPLLRPTIYFVTLISLIAALKVFGPMWIMTKGGPEGSTVSYVMHLYQVAFSPTHNFEFGYASALALLLAVFIFTMTALSQRLNKSMDS